MPKREIGRFEIIVNCFRHAHNIRAKLRQLAPLLPAFQIGPQTVRIVGTGLWANDPALAQETGLTGAWYAATDPDKWRTFADRYASVYGQAPDQRAGLVYDSITLIVALGKAASGYAGPDYSETALTNVSGFNGVTGDYSRGAAGFLITNGEIGPAVSEITVASNLKQMFATLEPASDLRLRRGIDSPTLLLPEMTVASA